MADLFNGLKFRVQEDIFDAQALKDEKNFYSQRQGSPSVLTRKLTYILGDYTKEYPISLMTEGGIGYDGKSMKRTSVELDDPQFTYPVMGRSGKVAVCIGSPYSGSDQPGIGNTPFFMYLNDNWIKRFKTIHSTNGIQAYVLEDPEPLVTGGYKYKVQLNPAAPTDYCPLTELANGVQWVDLTVNVAESESRGTEIGMQMPGMFKNQMGFLRLSMSWAGNAANKVMKIDIKNPVTGQETNVWMDYFMWQYEKEWLSIKEHSYWYSRYNRLPNGEIPLKDLLTGKVIPTGSGLLEQIPNRSSYSDLTYDFLSNKAGDALFAQADAAGLSITLHTGTGGRRAFHRAMVKAGAEIVGSFGAGNIADRFVTGTGRNLMLGGFFDGFYHIDGYTIKLKYNPIFDRGKVAQVSRKHPESGLPLESYRMVFIDDNDYDGQPNIQHVAQKGRSFLHGMVPGLTEAPKSVALALNMDPKSKVLATEMDKSSYHRFTSCGIQMLKGNRCFDLPCIAGL